MAEAMLSGCLVAAAPPDVEYGTLAHLILPLAKSDETLPVAQIEAALGRLAPGEFEKKLLRAFIFARQALVGPTRLAQVFSILDRWEHGARGYLVRPCAATLTPVPAQLQVELRLQGEEARVVLASRHRASRA
jgi:hypothetical protein